MRTATTALLVALIPGLASTACERGQPKATRTIIATDVSGPGSLNVSIKPNDIIAFDASKGRIDGTKVTIESGGKTATLADLKWSTLSERPGALMLVTGGSQPDYLNCSCCAEVGTLEALSACCVRFSSGPLGEPGSQATCTHYPASSGCTGPEYCSSGKGPCGSCAR